MSELLHQSEKLPTEPKSNKNSTPKEDNIIMKTDELEIKECTICYLEIQHSENKIALEECGHVFHSQCIRLWMKNKRTCPFCAGFSLLREEYPPLI